MAENTKTQGYGTSQRDVRDADEDAVIANALLTLETLRAARWLKQAKAQQAAKGVSESTRQGLRPRAATHPAGIDAMRRAVRELESLAHVVRREIDGVLYYARDLQQAEPEVPPADAPPMIVDHSIEALQGVHVIEDQLSTLRDLLLNEGRSSGVYECAAAASTGDAS